jgi:hypothetical protein
VRLFFFLFEMVVLLAGAALWLAVGGLSGCGGRGRLSLLVLFSFCIHLYPTFLYNFFLI